MVKSELIRAKEIPLDLVAGNPFLSGIYETADGRHVVPSAVYVDLVYQWCTFLGCAPNVSDVAAAIRRWTAKGEHRAASQRLTKLTIADLELASGRAGLPFAVVETEESWSKTEQGRLMASLPIVPVTKLTASPSKVFSLHPKRPLEGLKVLCLTHAIAGPSSGRTLAEYGASVLQIMYTHGFEHPFVYTYANLGCASSRLNLNTDDDRTQLWKLVQDADVWIDSYRDGALSRFGFTDENLLECNPTLVVSHVRVYGTRGPWASKPGFDMQGSASSGMMTLCGGGLSTPSWPPGQVINDYTTGYYGALAIQATILRQMTEGGGYILSPSLTGTAMSIVKHFKSSDYPELGHLSAHKLPPKELEDRTGLGILKTLQPLPSLSKTPLEYSHVVLSAMGSDLPIYPGSDALYNVKEVQPSDKEQLLKSWQSSIGRRMAELKHVAASFA